jgi:hypothetical protein
MNEITLAVVPWKPHHLSGQRVIINAMIVTFGSIFRISKICTDSFTMTEAVRISEPSQAAGRKPEWIRLVSVAPAISNKTITQFHPMKEEFKHGAFTLMKTVLIAFTPIWEDQRSHKFTETMEPERLLLISPVIKSHSITTDSMSHRRKSS